MLAGRSSRAGFVPFLALMARWSSAGMVFDDGVVVVAALVGDVASSAEVDPDSDAASVAAGSGLPFPSSLVLPFASDLDSLGLVSFGFVSDFGSFAFASLDFASDLTFAGVAPGTTGIVADDAVVLDPEAAEVFFASTGGGGGCDDDDDAVAVAAAATAAGWLSDLITE